MSFYLMLAALGLVGGFFAGLLGLGGAIVLVPLLLFVPPLLGFPALDMKVVAAISLVQVTFASLAAVMVHAKNNAVSRPVVLLMGATGAVASFAGGILSRYVAAQSLLVLFAVIATLGALLMFIPRKELETDTPANEIPFNRPAAVAIALAVGVIGGLVGAAGGFIYVPLLIYVLGIPTRITLGSTLAVVLISSLAGLVGKLVTGQVPLGLSAALVVGAIPGARWGGMASRRLSVTALRWMVTAIVVASTLKLWAEALPGVRLSAAEWFYLLAVAVPVLAVGWMVSRRLRGVTVPGPAFRLELSREGGSDVPVTTGQVGRLQPRELQELMTAGRPPRIIDVREHDEVAAGKIPGALHIPLGEFTQRLHEFGPEEDAVIVCRSGNRSGRACEAAARAGYRVRNLEGGMLRWSGPVEKR